MPAGDERSSQSIGAIPGGANPGACPSCGEWRIAGMVHQCDGADLPAYVFPTWRDALADAQAGIASAYGHRERIFRAAHEAGLSYREIGEATGLSAAAAWKVLGKRRRASLDSQVTDA